MLLMIKCNKLPIKCLLVNCALKPWNFSNSSKNLTNNPLYAYYVKKALKPREKEKKWESRFSVRDSFLISSFISPRGHLHSCICHPQAGPLQIKPFTWPS